LPSSVKPVKTQITTSKKELIELFIAWLMISIAFGIVLRPKGTVILSSLTLMYVGIAALTVGVGFLLHEFAHKVVAQRYRCWAEFRADGQMLVLALIMSFFGFVIAAPGAVMIYGNVTKKQNGLISLAGPLTNLILATIFLVLGILYGVSQLPHAFLGILLSMGFSVNAFLALFNMIPAWFFDGAKIWKWNKVVYFSVAGIALLFVVVSYLA
jgi:Zn-dependent protease